MSIFAMFLASVLGLFSGAASVDSCCCGASCGCEVCACDGNCGDGCACVGCACDCCSTAAATPSCCAVK